MLFVSRRLAPDDPGPFGRLVGRYAHAWRRHHVVELVAGYVRGRALIPSTALGVDLCGRGEVAAQWAMRRAVWRRGRAVAPQLVVSASPEAPRCGLPAIALILEAPELDGGLARRARVARLRGFRRIVVPDQHVADALTQAGLPDDRIAVVPPPLPTLHRSPTGDPTLQLVVAGPIAPAAGQHLAIDAVARLAPVEKARVHLEVVGSASDKVYFEQLRVQAHRQPISLRAAPEDALRCLGQADLALCTPLADGAFPDLTATAAHNDIPTIYADVPRLAEAMRGLPAASAIPAGDAGALRERIRAHLHAESGPPPSARADEGRYDETHVARLLAALSTQVADDAPP